MTKEELLAVKRHCRIKYVGSDSDILEEIKARASKAASTKGLVVDYIRDHSNSSWGNEREQGLTIRTWDGIWFEQVKPEDWVVVDSRRVDLLRSREKRQVKNTDHWVRRELARFSEHFKNLKSSKERIDGWLDDIPLASRLKILTSLSDEEKAWLQLIAMNPEEILSSLKKIVTEDSVEVSAPAEAETQPT